MKILILSKGENTVVDDDIYELVKDKRWHKTPSGYAARTTKTGSKIFLHRLIANTPKNLQTDHINGNKMDNLRSNLRIVNDQLNKFNMGLRSDNQSGYRGVTLRKDKKHKEVWTANIRKDGIRYRLGCYDSKEEAARAYNLMAKKLYKKHGRLNEIKTLSPL